MKESGKEKERKGKKIERKRVWQMWLVGWLIVCLLVGWRSEESMART